MQEYQPKSVIDHLSAVPLLSGLGSSELERIAKNAKEIILKNRQILFNKGDKPKGFYFLINGQIKLVCSSQDGHEKIVDFVRQGQSFGEANMLLQKPHIVYAQALSRSKVLYIPGAPIFEELETNTSLTCKMLGNLAMRLHQTVLDIETFSLCTGAQRTIGFLTRELSGQEDASERIVNLSYPKSVIASYLNLSPEHFSRILFELESLQLIEKNGLTIKIADASKLSAYLP